MSFWGELKRRNVYKVGVAYAIVAWLIIQAAAIVSPALQLPKWTLPLVIIFLSIGFIITLFLAWAYEVTPDGIKRTKEVPLSESITHITGKKLNYILVGLLVLAVAYILFNKYYLVPRMIQTKQLTVSSNVAKEAKMTIAVLPFTDLSPEKDQEYFTDGISEEILNTIAQIPDLNVSGRTSSFSFKDSNKTAQEIAEVLGVENILEGSVRKAGNILRITAQLLRAKDGFHLWSKSYDRELKNVSDILSIQEDIATAVANELKATLGVGTSLKQLGGTDNLEAYELYLIALGQSTNYDLAIFNRALELIDEAIALDPKFALAWALKANIHIARTIFGPANLADSERDEGLHAGQKAIELEPNLPEAYISLGHIKKNRGEWIEAESDFRKAFQLSTESILTVEMQYIISHYLAVGKIKRAYELIEEMRRKDPLNENIRTWYIYSLNLMGDTQRAEEEYERCRELFGDQWGGISFYILSQARAGVKLPVPLDEIPEVLADQYFYIAWEHFESPEKGLIELHRIYDDEENLSSRELISISWCAAYLGDSEFAVEPMENAYNIDAGNAFHFWEPVFHEVRQMPRFKEFIREIGLVDYWNKFGRPDLCYQLDNGDFECD